MATYEVSPLPDGADLRGNWQAVGPAETTTHTKKSAARRAARRRAGRGDLLVVRRTDGTVQERLRIKDASVEDDRGGDGLFAFGAGLDALGLE